MKFIFLILSFIISLPLLSQATRLSGFYTEYKRTLWNGDDGSDYTISGKPFETSMRFDFSKDKDSVVLYNGTIKMDQSYVITGDTLCLTLRFGKSEYARSMQTKYIIIEKAPELILQEYKPQLSKEHYVRQFYFRKGNTPEALSSKQAVTEIFTVVNEMPSYPGGMEAMKTFIGEEVAKSGLKGQEKVFLKLLIDPEGKIIQVDVLNNPRLPYMKEAVRIVRKLPAFNPGRQNGRAVYVYDNIPVFFK